MMRARLSFSALLAAAALVAAPWPSWAEDRTPYQEAMAQADRLFQAGNYRNAAERYFFASQTAKERLEYAQSYIGLAMSYFFLKDQASAEKWVKMVLEVAPRLEVAVPDYPISFVQLYERVRNDFFKGLPPPAADEKLARSEGSPPRAIDLPRDNPKPAPLSQPETREQPREEPPAPAPDTTRKVNLPPEAARPGGQFQVMFHASSWTIDPVINIVEGLVKDKVGDEIISLVSSDVRSKYFTLVESGSEQEIDFDSSGSNFGLEIRYFSRGWGGTFSIGLAFDRTSIRLALSGRVRQSFTNGTYAEADAQGTVSTDLSSTVLSFRWDIAPAARLSPFFIVGLGVTPFQGRVTYEYSGTYNAGIFQETISDGDDKTLEELAEEQDFSLMDVFFVLQLGVGLDIEIFRGLTGLVEAGIWDGFYLRGGLGYRF